MRGKAQAEQVRRFLNGITPAYAGKRTKSSRCPPRMWDHPRVCGEKNLCILRRVEIPGSPPRMRGKAPTKTGCSCPGGITPAHAGKRICPRPGRMNSEDHPRACGEKSFAVVNGVQNSGSPPHMRGKAPARRSFGSCRGITPAYAGKRTTLDCLEVLRRDHPRICGEKLSCSASLESMRGSPPHMRGKVYSPSSPYITSGITPAYAGKSTLLCFPAEPGWDHPRICGEKAKMPISLT